ncbi:unnamed protein product [Rotaria socialis]|uniref:NAD(+)--protein-arginine ADP-ribosyltransferase n=1 Tax=Rotaria socialis TaxID=392032 RepID=A0A817WZX2_9BILA|nr:unnamed protein product [Rotaria socialis]CAF4505919.1 unnamed protein product [Rotaria socialis]
MAMLNPRVGDILATNPNLTRAFFRDPQRPNSRFISFSPAATEYSQSYLQAADINPSDIIANFYPVIRKGPNYLRYCSGMLSEREKPASIRECVRKYTSDGAWFYNTINLALGSDSRVLKTYGSYIKQLKYSIAKSPIYYSGSVLRGMNLSQSEVNKYESMRQPFYIPSFTSTSRSKPFPGNTLFVIDVSPEWSEYCMEIPPDFSNFNEEEILLSCYNRYSYERTEKSSGQRIIKLRLLGDARPNNYNPLPNRHIPRYNNYNPRPNNYDPRRIGYNPRRSDYNARPFSYTGDIVQIYGWH